MSYAFFVRCDGCGTTDTDGREDYWHSGASGWAEVEVRNFADVKVRDLDEVEARDWADSESITVDFCPVCLKRVLKEVLA